MKKNNSDKKQTAIGYAFLNFGQAITDFLNGKLTQIEFAVKQTQIVERSKQKFKQQAWEFFQAGQNSMDEGGMSFDQYWEKHYGGDEE